jgi:hypothetical protein
VATVFYWTDAYVGCFQFFCFWSKTNALDPEVGIIYLSVRPTRVGFTIWLYKGGRYSFRILYSFNQKREGGKCSTYSKCQFTFLDVKFSVVQATCRTGKPDKLRALIIISIMLSKNIFNHWIPWFTFLANVWRKVCVIISSQNYLLFLDSLLYPEKVSLNT